MNAPIYLDAHAATPIHPRVQDAMREAWGRAWGNPSSTHSFGRKARADLERARDQIAQSVGARPSEIVLTSGGTEACNALVQGARAQPVLASELLHPAVIASLHDREVTWLDHAQWRDPSAWSALAARAGEKAQIVLPWVDHETASCLPIHEIALLCDEIGAELLVDATQALGRLPIDLQQTPIAKMAFASHKVGGPPGAGALFLRRGTEFSPQILGGGQEHGLRAGSPNLLAIIGFGAACTLLEARIAQGPQIEIWRAQIETRLRAAGAALNCVSTEGGEPLRTWSATNVSHPGIRREDLVAALDLEGVCISAGAACSSGLSAPSPIVSALYPEAPWRAAHSVRFSYAPEALDEAAIQTALVRIERVLARFG